MEESGQSFREQNLVPGSNEHVLKVKNYQLNIKSHVKVHKITDDPDSVSCDNTTGQWEWYNNMPEYVKWSVQKITDTASRYVLHSVRLTVRLQRQSGKLIRSHSLPARAVDLRRHEWQLPSSWTVSLAQEQWHDAMTLNVFILATVPRFTLPQRPSFTPQGGSQRHASLVAWWG